MPETRLMFNVHKSPRQRCLQCQSRSEQRTPHKLSNTRSRSEQQTPQRIWWLEALRAAVSTPNNRTKFTKYQCFTLQHWIRPSKQIVEHRDTTAEVISKCMPHALTLTTQAMHVAADQKASKQIVELAHCWIFRIFIGFKVLVGAGNAMRKPFLKSTGLYSSGTL